MHKSYVQIQNIYLVFICRVNNILADTNAVNVSNAAGIFDISGITTSETIGSLAGVANSSVVLGSKNLTVAGAANTTFAGVISGTNGTLTKTGALTLTLSGSNTYTGATTVSDGTLQVGVAGIGGITATSSVTVVKTGATNAPILSGSGTIGGAIVIGDTLTPGNKGILAPGDAGSSLNRTLTSTGSLTVAAGSQVLMGITSPTGTDASFVSGDAFTYLRGLGSFDGSVVGSAPAAWFTAPSTNQVDHLALGGALTLGTNSLGATAGQGIVSIFSNALVPASLTRGQIFNLIDWTGLSVTGFNAGSGFSTGGIHGDFDLPDILSTGLAWDTSAFASHGVLVVVPEPSRALLLLLGLMSLMLRRRRIC